MPRKSTEDQENHPEGILAATAKAIGGLAGTVAAAVGAGGTAEANEAPVSTPPQPAKSKLPKKNKSRLPRREKKEMKKKAAAKAV